VRVFSEKCKAGIQKFSIVASCSSRMGMPSRIGYERLHSLHLRLSSPRRVSGLRHTGQTRISRRSGEMSTGRLYSSCQRPAISFQPSATSKTDYILSILQAS